MKRTVTITLAVLLAISGAAFAQVGGLRGADVAAADDKAFEAKEYVGGKPGLQKPVARTFEQQPPVVPHAMRYFDEINLEGNQCLSCHGPEKYKEKRAPKLGDSHFVKAEGKPVVSMMRYQCDSCHVPQVDAKPLVENQFVGSPPPR